jgi:hypothetical protein
LAKADLASFSSLLEGVQAGVPGEPAGQGSRGMPFGWSAQRPTTVKANNAKTELTQRTLGL